MMMMIMMMKNTKFNRINWPQCNPICSQVSLNRKVEAIIECFLDSATPPWLQVFELYQLFFSSHLRQWQI